MLSESSEMYLQAVYRLTEKERGVSISAIARVLGHSLSTVSERVSRLAAAGYLSHEWREGVSLTERGHRAACRTLRKRRLIETFLFQLADYGIHELYEEACRLEHLISDRFADALDRILGFPLHDPHGHPIPTQDGMIRTEPREALSETREGNPVRIAQLRTNNPDILSYAFLLGLVPGRICTVIEKAPLQGPVTVEIGSGRVAISLAIASIIDVHADKEVQSA